MSRIRMQCIRTELGFLISSNSKTGLSLNFGPVGVGGAGGVCAGATEWCMRHCYGRFRDKAMADAMGSSPNCGPITWKKQQDAYALNTQLVRSAVDGGWMGSLAADIAAAVPQGVVLRGNGVGDLFPGLPELYALLASMGVKLFLFSRVPPMIEELRRLCSAMEGSNYLPPYILGSVDPSTTAIEIDELLRTADTLAYACSASARDRAAYDLACRSPWWLYVDVVFGYHASTIKTKIGSSKECPSTAGEDIKCVECKRCYGWHRGA